MFQTANQIGVNTKMIWNGLIYKYVYIYICLKIILKILKVNWDLQILGMQNEQDL